MFKYNLPKNPLNQTINKNEGDPQMNNLAYFSPIIDFLQITSDLKALPLVTLSKSKKVSCLQRAWHNEALRVLLSFLYSNSCDSTPFVLFLQQRSFLLKFCKRFHIKEIWLAIYAKLVLTQRLIMNWREGVETIEHGHDLL